MGNTKSAEKKGIGALNWTLLLVIGFSAQIAWVIENNWFANFLYSDFGAQLGVVTAMTMLGNRDDIFRAVFRNTVRPHWFAQEAHSLGLDTLGNFHHCLRAYALSARQHL